MAIYVLKLTTAKSYGVFAARRMGEGEHVFRVDLTGLRKRTLRELGAHLAQHPELDGDHAHYVGRGKYVLDHSPGSYMNHSCDPSC